jgi:hypothetical protein
MEVFSWKVFYLFNLNEGNSKGNLKLIKGL